MLSGVLYNKCGISLHLALLICGDGYAGLHATVLHHLPPDALFHTHLTETATGVELGLLGVVSHEAAISSRRGRVRGEGEGEEGWCS
jgi:hypothetical protein